MRTKKKNKNYRTIKAAKIEEKSNAGLLNLAKEQGLNAFKTAKRTLGLLIPVGINKYLTAIGKIKFNLEKARYLFIVFLISFIVSFIIFFVALITLQNFSKARLTKNTPKISSIPRSELKFTSSENLFFYDPAQLINDIDNQREDYVLIDTRSKKEYEDGRIKGAVNVPLYTDFQNIEKTKVELSDFEKKVRLASHDKKIIIIYSYYTKAQTLIDGSEYLWKKNIKNRILSVSWYEFKNNPFSWLPGNDQGILDVNKYLEGKMYQSNK